MNHAFSQFTAVITARTHRGETTHSAAIFLATKTRRPLLRFPDRPTQQAVLLDVRDWALRHGKTQHLIWHYENNHCSLRPGHPQEPRRSS